jgi:hypothetical protein
VLAVIEVETGESVNHLEAMAEWAHYARLKAPFHLYVPMGSVDVARRLAADNNIALAEIFSFHQVGDLVRFASVYRTGPAFRLPDDPPTPPEPARTEVKSAPPAPAKVVVVKAVKAPVAAKPVVPAKPPAKPAAKPAASTPKPMPVAARKVAPPAPAKKVVKAAKPPARKPVKVAAKPVAKKAAPKKGAKRK